MNSKHQRFVDNYVVYQNATKAAIAAGYSEKTARTQGSRLLTYDDISQAIASRQESISSELHITAEDKCKALWRIVQFCSEVVSDGDGGFRMRDPRAATSAIAELNKMDGTYKTNTSDMTQVTFIQQFGDDESESTMLISDTNI
ncbi:terminase small subunit [Sansalvadorimonas verongulae]|uniref:terminase small subunit n=1 Tax=Sansalvadorimonas verongulae TaxID=2172824 RepID=UPI0012BD7C0B|nr:terminase small subunit [Sansalvadorimonas verongulae]MTI13310.1 terminase small subunit [Sansalvadorimonas verongulae]